jgi:alpha-glucosidase
MKKFSSIIVIFLFLGMTVQAKQYAIKSPDKKISVAISIGKSLSFSIRYNGKILLAPSPVAMHLKGSNFGPNAKVIKIQKESHINIVPPEIFTKSDKIVNHYNQLSLFFKGNYSFSVRVFNNGMAYRFESARNDKIYVQSESAEYHFPDNDMCWWAHEKDFHSNNQVFYHYQSLLSLNKDDLGSLPLIVQTTEGLKMVITESDLNDYPGMWLHGAQGTSLTMTHPAYPKTSEQIGDREVFVRKTQDYIAKTSGNRTFPWRIIAIAPHDADLITNQLVYLLASPCQLKDISWIKPGKVAWDWWNANNIYGVNFKAGINTQTYKYYIDFAAKYGIPYIILDEGWYQLGDLTKLNPNINMDELNRYARQKGVGIILWVVWKTLDDQLEQAYAEFEKWGIKGIKVDFMDRDDQWMVNYYHKIARTAAEHHLLVDFHGAYKPAGLRRMYPNIITREAVNGAEEFKWSYHETPEHDLILPFGRMMTGPMDYTPGAMNNAQKENFKPIFNRPMSMGTRCHQLAMYVCYESPLQMLCDAPSNYYRQPEAMEFLSKVPTVWNETKVLKAKVSDYLIVARRNGNNWFIGGMTDWTSRRFTLSFSFLKKNKKYRIIYLEDGVNADHIATDFKRVSKIITAADTLTIRMAKGGGYAAQIIPIDINIK